MNMGSYGSGRTAERRSVEESYALPVNQAAAALRALRAGQCGAGLWHWQRNGQVIATIGYKVIEDASGPWCELRYSANGQNGQAVIDRLALVERPSNLPSVAGAVVYWRCACYQLARVLYLGSGQRWRCRRCVPVVYQSSRDSDQRVSDLLAQAAQLVRLDWGDTLDADPELLATLSAATLTQRFRALDRNLFVAMKALDRLGLGISDKHRSPR